MRLLGYSSAEYIFEPFHIPTEYCGVVTKKVSDSYRTKSTISVLETLLSCY